MLYMNKEMDVTEIDPDIKRNTITLHLYLGIKRLFDIIFSIIGIIFLIPVSILVKISYMLTGDFSSIFFTQDRIGKDGKNFKFFKFRTMVPNADKILFELLEKDKKLAKEYKVNKKLKNDPRITKAGKILRKTSLDELPQLINIFLGQMSFVGNRPYLPREKEDMGIDYLTISRMTPGLTGPWQVSGRSNTSFEDRCMLDVQYYIDRNLKTDLNILFKTVEVVFKKTGAK